MKERSLRGVVHSGVEVKSWAKEPPSVDRVRPASCPVCGAAGRPEGRALCIVGHGLRARQICGPYGEEGIAVMLVIDVRRYRCRGCRSILTVVPLGVVRARHYGAAAIGLALLLLGVGGDAGEARRRVSPWRASFEDPCWWPTLRRWVHAIDAQRLFRGLRPSPVAWSLRQRAERAAMTLVAMSPPSLTFADLEARVIAGAALAA